MTCRELVARIEQMHPDASPREVARACLLLVNQCEELHDLDDEQHLAEAWHAMNIRLQAATDQHAAMTEELERLAGSLTGKITAERVRVLLRAVRVQSQLLSLYAGQPRVEA